MTSDFYLFIPKRDNTALELNSIELSWVYTDNNNELKLAQGTLNDVVTASAGHYITVVLSGEDVLFLNAEVPGKNIQRVKQAIPYVLEDNVVNDVEELYFAIKKINDNPLNNEYNVSVLDKEYFELVILQLETAGIQADAMIADYFLLEDNTLLFDGERIIFSNAKIKFSSSIDGAVVLDESNTIDDKVIKLINCDKTNSNSTSLESLEKTISLEEKTCDMSAKLCLVKHSSKGNAINLLQGTHKKKKNWSQAGKTWLPVAVLFCIWLVVQGGMFISDYISLNNKNKLLNAEIIKIYKNAFPKSRRIIDAKAQMQQKLTSLKRRKGQSGRSFTEMLSRSASVFATTNGLEIKSLRYYDGRINLEIQIASLQVLDKLKDQLNKENGYQVEIQNASSGKDIVTAQIQITGVK